MLYKVTHNQSTQLAEDHLKCSVEGSRFTSGVDYIEEKTHYLSIIIPPRNEEP